jgi:hypothetical protein
MKGLSAVISGYNKLTSDRLGNGGVVEALLMRR